MLKYIIPNSKLNDDIYKFVFKKQHEARKKPG